MGPNKRTTFLAPDRATLDRIASDAAIETRYTSALALLDDLICDYSDTHPRRRFQDRADLARQIKELLMIDPRVEPDPADRPAIENLRSNLRRILKLRKRARAAAGTPDRDRVRAEVTAFLDAMLDTFALFTWGMSGGRPSKAQGA